MTENVERNEGYSQVCVWPGTTLGDAQEQEFVKFFQEELGTRIQFLEVVLTFPDVKDCVVVEGTGGRSDIFFAVHNEDIGKFAVPRLQYGMRWIEDVYLNGNGVLYPERIASYRTW